MPSSRQQSGRYGGLSWSTTVDRTSRTDPARRAGPSNVDHCLKRLPEKFADASERQKMQAAEAARKAYYAELSMRSAQSRAAQERRDRKELRPVARRGNGTTSRRRQTSPVNLPQRVVGLPSTRGDPCQTT